MIWIIGGTSDANLIVQQLLDNKFENIIISTTTPYGSALAEKKGLQIIQQALTYNDMKDLIMHHSIQFVVDASHPFAAEVSLNAIKASVDCSITYIRYERENLKYEGVDYHDDYDSILRVLQLTKGNIFLTIGSKNVYYFKDIAERVIARVLPVVDSIQQCEKAGLKAHQILAMKGRVSQLTNETLLQEYDIQYLVTKDSGEAGGLSEKINAAHNQGVKVIVLERPKINYPISVSSFEGIIHHLN